MRRFAFTGIIVAALSIAGADPGAAKPFLRQDPAHAAIVFMECTVRIADHGASGAIRHGPTSGKAPRREDYPGGATLGRVSAGGKPIKASRYGDALVFADLAPGWYRLAGVEADVSTVVPPEAISRNPGEKYVYSYPFNPQDAPDGLTFQVAAGEVRFLGSVRVEEHDAPTVAKDGSIQSWQKDNHWFRVERNRHEELKSLRGLARAAKQTPWAGIVDARIAKLRSGAPTDSSEDQWR